MRDKKWQRRTTIFLGIFLSFGMVILPMLSQSIGQPQSAPVPTVTPAPTAPAPPDIAMISFDNEYLHSSGLFMAAIPSGWAVSNEFSNAGEAQLTMQNPNALSVLEVRIIQANEGVELDSPNKLGAQFTEDWLRSSWRQYSTWREDARKVEGDQLVIDFNLSRSGQEYVARQVAFTDGTWIYSVRVIMPSNATEALKYVLENEVASFHRVDRFIGAPLDWSSYFDNSSKHLIRFPSAWAVTDAADGTPASIVGINTQMRVETTAMVDSPDAASAFVATLRTGTQVQTVEAVEQFGLRGYRVSYLVPSLDGPTQSGLVLILNDENGIAHVANVLLTDVQNTDLNTVDVTAEDTAQNIKDVYQTLTTFSVLPEIQLSSN
jgi:hypothetical protein